MNIHGKKSGQNLRKIRIKNIWLHLEITAPASDMTARSWEIRKVRKIGSILYNEVFGIVNVQPVHNLTEI